LKSFASLREGERIAREGERIAREGERMKEIHLKKRETPIDCGTKFHH
jgi:hypothetical protein